MSYPNPITQYFRVNGDAILDASVDFTSDALVICQNYSFIVTPTFSTVLQGSPVYTLEVSTDQINWFEYGEGGKFPVAIDTAVRSRYSAASYYRIIYDAKNASGTISFPIQLKHT